MILKKEIIEKAVNWWVEKVTANQPHSNGDNGYTSIVTCLLADSRTKKISKKQTDVFKKALAREIEEEAKKRTRFSICCDYRWFKRRPGENQNGRSALAQCSGKRGADRNDGQPVGGSDAPCDMAAGRAGCAGYFGEKA